ncbi:MAG: hypothetical protein WCR27_03575 [Eubacteriales bacterium]
MYITSITAGIVLIIIGITVWKLRMVNIIADRRPGRKTDKEGLAKWMGMNLIYMGFFVCLSVLAQILFLKTTKIIFDIGIIIIFSTRMAAGATKFEIEEKSNKVKKIKIPKGSHSKKQSAVIDDKVKSQNKEN